jgi:hypothetical protein
VPKRRGLAHPFDALHDRRRLCHRKAAKQHRACRQLLDRRYGQRHVDAKSAAVCLIGLHHPSESIGLIARHGK